MGWLGDFAWCSLYLATTFMVPEKRMCRGLFTRHILMRAIPIKRAWRAISKWTRNMFRYYIWLGAWDIASVIRHIPHHTFDATFFGSYTLILLDDYFFGDEDKRKRFREWCGNKIKWLMEIPPAPIPDEVA